MKDLLVVVLLLISASNSIALRRKRLSLLVGTDANAERSQNRGEFFLSDQQERHLRSHKLAVTHRRDDNTNVEVTQKENFEAFLLQDTMSMPAATAVPAPVTAPAMSAPVAAPVDGNMPTTPAETPVQAPVAAETPEPVADETPSQDPVPEEAPTEAPAVESPTGDAEPTSEGNVPAEVCSDKGRSEALLLLLQDFVDKETLLDASTPQGRAYEFMVNTGSDSDSNCVGRTSAVQTFGLSVFFDVTNGTEWKNSTGWMQSSDSCSWRGVVCDDTGAVAELKLGMYGVQGVAIPLV